MMLDGLEKMMYRWKAKTVGLFFFIPWVSIRLVLRKQERGTTPGHPKNR